jgi:hypothetical protein
MIDRVTSLYFVWQIIAENRCVYNVFVTIIPFNRTFYSNNQRILACPVERGWFIDSIKEDDELSKSSAIAHLTTRTEYHRIHNTIDTKFIREEIGSYAFFPLLNILFDM